MKDDYQNTEDSVLYLLIPQECFILSFSERSHFRPDASFSDVGGENFEISVSRDSVVKIGHKNLLAINKHCLQHPSPTSI